MALGLRTDSEKANNRELVRIILEGEQGYIPLARVTDRAKKTLSPEEANIISYTPLKYAISGKKSPYIAAVLKENGIEIISIMRSKVLSDGSMIFEEYKSESKHSNY